MIEPEPYVSNVVALWSSLGELSEPIPGVIRVETPWVIRLFTTEPTSAGTLLSLLQDEPLTKAVVGENSFGNAEPIALPEGITLKHMPVMIRPAGSVPTGSAVVTKVSTPAEYAPARQVIIDGFPARNAWPESILDNPQFAVWLARHEGTPASAMYTFDDGNSAGIYLLATLPEFRGLGLGRSVLTHAMATTPNRQTVLVATEAGQPLYERLGFHKVSNATWYFRR